MPLFPGTIFIVEIYQYLLTIILPRSLSFRIINYEYSLCSMQTFNKLGLHLSAVNASWNRLSGIFLSA